MGIEIRCPFTSVPLKLLLSVIVNVVSVLTIFACRLDTITADASITTSHFVSLPIHISLELIGYPGLSCRSVKTSSALSGFVGVSFTGSGGEDSGFETDGLGTSAGGSGALCAAAGGGVDSAF